MKGIAEWLASIGLSEYAQRFAENAIDLYKTLKTSAFCLGIAARFCARSRSLVGWLLRRLKQRPNRSRVTTLSAVTSR